MQRCHALPNESGLVAGTHTHITPISLGVSALGTKAANVNPSHNRLCLSYLTEHPESSQ